jgi:chromate transporter
VAAALVAATAIKMALGLPRRWKNISFAGLMFVTIAILRWPLLAVMAVLIPLALVTFGKGRHRERR